MQYDTLAGADIIEKTATALRERGIEVHVVADKAAALEKVKSLIPAGASVMNGSSTTLKEIGFVEYLTEGTHGWNNLHTAILAEKDPAAQAALRQQAIHADYFLGSVHAIAEGGESVTASASGSQLAPYVFTAKNIIWVAGAQKIVPTVNDALARLRDYVYPLEDKRMADAGQGGSTMAKILLFEREPAFTGRKVVMVLVNEKLGF